MTLPAPAQDATPAAKAAYLAAGKSAAVAHRPSKSDVLTRDQAAAIDRAKSYHAGCLKSFGDQMGYAFLAGLELNTLQKEISRGCAPTDPRNPWGDFLAAHFPDVPRPSACRYMRFHAELAKAFPTVAKVKLITDGSSINQEDREKVLQAVHAVADGKTLTQLYRDLGVIRQPTPPAGTGRKSKTTVTADDDGSYLTHLRSVLLLALDDESRSIEECTTAQLLKFEPVLTAFNDRFKAVLTRRKSRPAPASNS